MKLKLLLIVSFSVISWNTFQNDNFIFQKGNQKVTLEIEDGVQFLKWNKKTKITIKTENIDNRKLSLSAPGLRLLNGATDDKNESTWEINAEKKYVKNDTLKLFISGRDLKDSIWSHQFKIVIKQ